MLEIMNGCPLAHAQFPNDKNQSFYEWWMGKLGIKLIGINKKRMRIFMSYIAPFIIIGLAVLLQVAVDFIPLLRLPF
jgi:hypothetical protein